MHNLRTVDILVSACLYQKTNLQSKHTPGRAAVLAVLRESRTMPIKELCRWPNFIICCQPIDSLGYMYPSYDKETRIESENTNERAEERQHSFNASRGLAGQPTDASSISTLNV